MLKTIVSKGLIYEFTRVRIIIPAKATKPIGEIYPYEKTHGDF